MSKKKHPRDESSENNPAFQTQPMTDPDGQPIQPEHPELNDPAFATQAIPPTADAAPSDESQEDTPSKGQPPGDPSVYATQAMTDADGEPVTPGAPELNNPAFATQAMTPPDEAAQSPDAPETPEPPQAGSPFATQVMTDADGEPVTPGAPELNNPAFATQAMTPPDDSEQPPDTPEPPQADSPFATQVMTDADGKPVQPGAPNLNDPAFATQVLPPAGDDNDSDDDGFSLGTQPELPGQESAFATQTMAGPDGQPVDPGHPEQDNPAYATQVMTPATGDQENRGQALPSEERLKEISQTIPATGDQIAKIAEVARTQQHVLTLPDNKVVSGLQQQEAPKNRSGRSTWNLRIKQRGVQGHVSGIINEIPADSSRSTGLQSALVSDPSAPEFEVVNELGAGNMGIVYRARQTSLNRELAIKTLKPTSKNSEHDQAMFVSEAVVTANLVHPNIVPIHDLGRTSDGKLFYAMKQVSGTPWNEIIRDNSLEENLDIFMKMCDAVAYAHSRGVINRDLKPENVVVGDFGEVNVLDWGLAITTDAFEKKDSVVVNFRGGGGTPVYMAPELAHEDISGIGTHSDIYLLGAILFEVLEGFPPHLLRKAWESENPQNQLQSVIFAVFNNEIEEDVEHEGELMEIARRAMRTDPAERWATVDEFQDAIREYRITGRAEELMHELSEEATTTYSKYQSALALYGDALRKWPENQRAYEGDRKARLAYAELAHKNGDIDLGLQVLPADDDPQFADIRTKLRRTQRNRAIVRTTWLILFVAAVGLFFASVGLSGWLVATNNELLNAEQALSDKTEEAETQAARAREQTEKAREQTEIAQQQSEIAKEQAELANREREAAAREKQLADVARAEAQQQTQLADMARAEVRDLEESVEVARQEVATQMLAANNARKDAENERELADAARKSAEQQKQLADKARKQADEQKQLALTATEQADQQKALADAARKEAKEQTDLAEIAKEEAVEQKKLAEQQTLLAAAAEQEKLQALKDAEKTRIEGRLEQVDAKMEIRKYDDVVKLVDQALVEFESIADQPDLLELLAKKKQEAERLTGNTSARLEGKTNRAAASPDGTTLVVSAWDDVPSVTIFRDVASAGVTVDGGTRLQPRGRTVRDVTVSNDGTVVSVIGRSQTSRNFFHQLWTRQGSEYSQVAWSEYTSRRPPKCLLSPGGQHAYLLTSGRTGTITVYRCTGPDTNVIRKQTLDESTETFPDIHDAVLLPDESALIVATREGCRSIDLKWSPDNSDVQITHLKKGQAFNNVFPAPRGLNRLGIGGTRDRFDPRRLALSADGSMLALISGTRVIALPRDPSPAEGDFPYISPDQLTGNGIIDTSYGTRISAGFSADGTRLVTAGRRYIQVWDRDGETWKLSTVDNLYDGNSIAGHSRSVELVSFIDGTDGQLISVSGDSVVRTWNPATYSDYVDGMSGMIEAFRQGASAAAQRLDTSAVQPKREASQTAVAQTPAIQPLTKTQAVRNQRKNRWLLTDAQQQTPAPRARRIRQARRVFSAEFSRDSERVVVGANDLAAHSFESRTASRTGTMSTQLPRDSFFAPERNNFLEGHIPEIVSVQFLPPDGELLLTLDYFGSISVWDAQDDEDGIGFEKSRPVPSEPVVSEDPERPYEVDDPSCEITVSSDGRWIMAGGVRNDGNVDIRQSSDECFVALWKTEDVRNSATPRPWRVLEGEHPSRVTAAAFSPDSRLALTAGRRGRLVLWDFENDQVVAVKDDTHGSDGVSGAFFVSETEFITAGFDGKVYRWTIGPDGLSETVIPRGDGQKDPDFIVRIRASADGRRFITSDLTKGQDGISYRLTLNVWSSTSGWQTTLPAGINAPPDDLGRSYRHDISWSPDGKDVLFVHDETLLVFDTQTWKPKTGFRLPPDSRAVRGTFAPSNTHGTRIATFDGRFAHLWNIDSGEHVAEFRSHGPFVRAGYSSDRRFLITGSESIRIFHSDEDSPDHGRPVFRLSRKATGRSVFADVRFSPALNDYRFASVDRLGAVSLWDWTPDSGPPTAPSFSSAGPEDMQAEYSLPNAICWSHDAKYLAAIQLGQVMLWALDDTGPRQIEIKYPRGIAAVDLIMNDLDFSDDGTRLTAGGSYEDESYALVWTLSDNVAAPTASIDAEEYHSSWDDNADGLTGITCIGFDNGRNEILTGGADSRVLRWQIRRPDPGEVIELPYIASMLGGPNDEFRTPHTASVSDLDVAGNGSILTADEAGYFVIWPSTR